MGESFDLKEFSRIARKRKELGRESLTDEERAYYDRCMKALRPMFEKLSDPDTQVGFAAYEQMSPEDQERYGDWDPADLQAFLPLLEEEPDEDDFQVL